MERPGWVDGLVQVREVVVESERMLEIKFSIHTRVYCHLSPCPYDAALFGRMHAPLVGWKQKWTPDLDRVPGGD